MEIKRADHHFFTSFLIFIFFFFLSSSKNCCIRLTMAQNTTKTPFPVGLVLDMETSIGKVSKTSISMAFEDFYANHGNYKTRVVLHARDSNKQVIGAASAAVDLLKNVEVQAIIGPLASAQADFLIDLGNKTKVPILSFSATSPSLSHAYTPYFVRTALNDSSQANAIAALVKNFGWREVVPIYEDSDYGTGVIPYLTDALFLVDAKVPYRSVISPFDTDDQIKEELYKLMTMQTRVFVVHMSSSVGSRLFAMANEVKMMADGYVWIITDGLTNLLDSMDKTVLDSMQGVLGLKPYVQRTKVFDEFTRRWRMRFLQENPSSITTELSIFGLWAYDTAWALAMAAEKVGAAGNSRFSRTQVLDNSTDLGTLGISPVGPSLLSTILSTKFNGPGGEFYLVDGQLQASTFQLVNVNGRVGREIGFWTPTTGVSRKLNSTNNSITSPTDVELGPIIWPGEVSSVPKGWQIPTAGKKLRIGVPLKNGFNEFVNVETNHVTGFCIDVFDEAMKNLRYAVPYEFVPFVNASRQSDGTYNDLIYQVYMKEFDAVVGDTTIIANRSLYVDFTLPYTESGVSMIAPIKKDDTKNAWIFFKPWTTDLWLASFAFFFFTGFMVWVIEHQINPEFRGPPSQQMGMIFYFAFSTLVFAHKEKVESNLSRFAVIVWVFVVLILTSSYTASLTSMLTVQNLEPTVTDVNELITKGYHVGYQDGSFVVGLLKQLGFDESKLKVYNTPDEYANALSNGSGNGGVAAIFDEIPYIKLFLSKYSDGYTMVGPTYKTDGFGFVFPIGSPLVPDVSRAVLNVTQGDAMTRIERKWFGDQSSSAGQSSITSNRLSFKNFWGLFLITGLVSSMALFAFFVMFIYQNWGEVKDLAASKSPVRNKLLRSVRLFDQKKLDSHTFRYAGDVEASLHNAETQNPYISSTVQTSTCPSDEEIINAEPANHNAELQPNISYEITEIRS